MDSTVSIQLLKRHFEAVRHRCTLASIVAKEMLPQEKVRALKISLLRFLAGEDLSAEDKIGLDELAKHFIGKLPPGDWDLESMRVLNKPVVEHMDLLSVVGETLRSTMSDEAKIDRIIDILI